MLVLVLNSFLEYGESSLGYHVCRASTLLSEAFPQPLNLFLKIIYQLLCWYLHLPSPAPEIKFLKIVEIVELEYHTRTHFFTHIAFILYPWKWLQCCFQQYDAKKSTGSCFLYSCLTSSITVLECSHPKSARKLLDFKVIQVASIQWLWLPSN